MRALACVMAILLAFLVPVDGAAQQVTDSFQDLARRGLLEVGDEIWIICDLRGTGQYRDYTAEVVALTDSSITIRGDVGEFGGEEQFTIPADRVMQIDAKRIDRGKGAIIGLAIGLGAAAAVALPIAAVCANETGKDVCTTGAFLGMVAGAGAGAGIGAAIGKGRQVEAFRAPGTQIALSPIVTRDRKGVVFTINW